MSPHPQSLRNAVSAICPDIYERVNTRKAGKTIQEQQLWWDLSSCVLSSQVPYTLATAAADRIGDSGILSTYSNKDTEQVRCVLSELLHSPLKVGNKTRKYRFPDLRAKQLADAWTVIQEEGGSLKRIIDTKSADPWALRKWLVSRIPGLGPKQASMFLRNVGASYDLAVLDRHVLNYMSAIGLANKALHSIGSLSAYRKQEHVLEKHAEEFGYPVGMVDWAIWIVMRAVGNTKSKEMAWA
ncbi:8-oxoguanine DNA glycosylase [Magnetococcus sp. PR-3]|uniref:8-oxoguanine DNA glycosylase n=1 Tax=Magnetococcus sp. PR-3 TaxID=3120355 RepID=UPI002FCE3317